MQSLHFHDDPMTNAILVGLVLAGIMLVPSIAFMLFIDRIISVRPCVVSCVMCHVSCVMCHVSCVTCHVSRVNVDEEQQLVSS